MMKAINHVQIVGGALAALFLFTGSSGEVQAGSPFTCASDLIAQGASSSTAKEFLNGYCFEASTCSGLGTKILKIPRNGEGSDEEIAKAKAVADDACNACTSGGKPRCLKTWQ